MGIPAGPESPDAQAPTDPLRRAALVVTAVVVPHGPARPELAALRTLVTRTLGPAAAPRHLVLVEHLPGRGPGKVDRRAVVRLAEAAVDPARS